MYNFLFNLRYLWLTALTLFFNVMLSFAAGTKASSALNAATTEVRDSFDAASNLMLAIGAIVGIIGGIMCYSKYSGGDPEGGKKIAKWIGGCVFLCLVPTILKAFFGV